MCQNRPNPNSPSSNQSQETPMEGAAAPTEMAWVWQRLCTLYNRVWERFRLQRHMDQIQQIIRERPQMAIFSAILILLCALPLLGFITFVLITITVTFFGFVFVEGTLLTIATLVLCCILLVLGLIGVTIATIVVVIYTGMTGGRGAFQEAFENFSRFFNDAIQQTAMRDYWNQHWASHTAATAAAAAAATSSANTAQQSPPASAPSDSMHQAPTAPPEDIQNDQPTLRQRNIYPDLATGVH